METESTDPRRVSILICSRERRDKLRSLVQSLLLMPSAQPYEIVVVEETDEPASIDGVKYVSHPVLNRGIPYARNLSLTYATGWIIVFLDDDCTILENWLEALLAPFQDNTVVGVQGGVTVSPGCNSIGWAESILGFPGGGVKRVLESEGKIEETREISTLNCAYRRSVIDKVGGFDERLKLGAEDYILAKQACKYGRCLFAPEALVSHDSRGSLSKIWKWFVRRGKSEIKALRTRGREEYDFSIVLKASISLKLCILAIVGLAIKINLFVLLAAALISYAVLQYVRYFRIWKKTGTSRKAFYSIPVVKLVMDIATDWGRIRGLLVG